MLFLSLNLGFLFHDYDQKIIIFSIDSFDHFAKLLTRYIVHRSYMRCSTLAIRSDDDDMRPYLGLYC